MAKKKVGLLVMAYGTPYKEEDIERYYTDIRHGRKPSPEALQDLTDRYRAIGGISPLAKRTEQQKEAIAKQANKMQNEVEFVPYLGLKHIEPSIEDAVKQMADDGIEEAVSLVLAPHYSTFSVKAYNGRAQAEAEKQGKPVISSVESWYDEPGFIDYWKKAILGEYDKMSPEEKEKAVLIVSAHSLPEKILKDGDPYPEQLNTTAKMISEATGIKNYEIGWQSEGNTPDPWLGPDVQDLTRDLYKEKGYRTFVYAPVGFIVDHLEVRYDNDYECKVVCDELGASYYRPPMPNIAPEFIETLADVVLKKYQSAEMV
ncbi:ferrochelatase [Paraliobacillus quinghaiensis]|uniref:Coproporphyrin III ferrochelatase n=1 Tax=Paraliobacillus quinghaiensis TaxID=470815 RepID=A0A917WRG4_9BACI|nr:ferrochelatase [Paraliobacillus quinghaiensis]GGM25294.1 ferrochelatase [Paraliobacillus quinghaiensis]